MQKKFGYVLYFLISQNTLVSKGEQKKKKSQPAPPLPQPWKDTRFIQLFLKIWP